MLAVYRKALPTTCRLENALKKYFRFILFPCNRKSRRRRFFFILCRRHVVGMVGLKLIFVLFFICVAEYVNDVISSGYTDDNSSVKGGRNPREIFFFFFILFFNDVR